MSRRILAACAVPVLALLLRSAPALAQGAEAPVTLPDLTGLPEVAPPPDSADRAGGLPADLGYLPMVESGYQPRPGMYLRIPN
jgi:hypothetical protein